MNPFSGEMILNGAKEIVKATGDALDELITSKEERLKVRQAMSQIIMQHLTQLSAQQAQVLNTELQGSKLQRNWRPIVMLAFAAIIVYHYFLQPVIGTWLSMPVVELPDRFWNLLEIGLGGYVIGRSVEKVANTVSQNMDILPRRRTRKNRRKRGGDAAAE